MSLAARTSSGPTPASRPDRTDRPHRPGWEAELELRFGRLRGRNALTFRRHRGPLRVQRPFLPDPAGPCQVIILHPPGGVVCGDHVAVAVDVEDGVEALVTTPAATRFYRSDGPVSRQRTRLRVARGGFLEWVPQETLVFDGARAEIGTHVELEDGARFLGWEIVCLGLPASGRPFRAGACGLRFEIRRNGVPVWIDRARWLGGGETLTASWGLASYPVVATLVLAGATAAAAAEARETLSLDGIDGLAGVTRIGEVLLCRVLARETRPVLEAFARVRARLRRCVSDALPSTPRIWAT